LAPPPRRAQPERRAAALCEEVAARAEGGGVVVVDDAPPPIRGGVQPERAPSPEEALELLAALGSDASPEEGAERAGEAEGWMAGVVLSARPGGDPLHYLLREGAAPLPEAAAALLAD